MIAFEFDFERPGTPQAAFERWNEAVKHKQTPLYYSGGTEIVTGMRKGTIKADLLIDLKSIETYTSLGEGKSPMTKGALWLGGGVTLGELARIWPETLLSEVAGGIADHSVRNTLTLGGNVCGRLAYREICLALLTLEADVVLFGAGGYVRKALAEVFHKRLDLEPGQILMGFELNVETLYVCRYFRRRRQKQNQIDYPICHTVVVRHGDRFRAAVSGVSPYVWYGDKTSDTLRVGADPLDNAMIIYQRLEVLAASDGRASKEYKLALLKMDLIQAFTVLSGQAAVDHAIESKGGGGDA
jgi:CO/xanthine dehydrogenase FAD-binding subunit